MATKRSGQLRPTSRSKRARHANGNASTTLSTTRISQLKVAEADRRNAGLSGMVFSIFTTDLYLSYFIELTVEQRESIRVLRDGTPPPFDDGHPDWEMVDAVLKGDATLDISNAGGEFEELSQPREYAVHNV